MVKSSRIIRTDIRIKNINWAMHRHRNTLPVWRWLCSSKSLARGNCLWQMPHWCPPSVLDLVTLDLVLMLWALDWCRDKAACDEHAFWHMSHVWPGWVLMWRVRLWWQRNTSPHCLQVRFFLRLSWSAMWLAYCTKSLRIAPHRRQTNLPPACCR